MISLPDPIRLIERLRERHQERPAPAFEDFSAVQQLDALEIACRNPFFVSCRVEALPESDDYLAFLDALTDSCVTNEEIGRRARDIVLAYVQACAQRRGESLAEFVR